MVDIDYIEIVFTNGTTHILDSNAEMDLSEWDGILNIKSLITLMMNPAESLAEGNQMAIQDTMTITATLTWEPDTKEEINRLHKKRKKQKKALGKTNKRIRKLQKACPGDHHWRNRVQGSDGNWYGSCRICRKEY